uniref:Uncharacterized protein n=1 Tax=virus sp. ctQmo6 TaxID=2827990 RepID=A0A8S5RFD6_9VIRU|nr:MAG TPA: hypothetical protein [virus sp. ctQmo6]
MQKGHLNGVLFSFEKEVFYGVCKKNYILSQLRS